MNEYIVILRILYFGTVLISFITASMVVKLICMLFNFDVFSLEGWVITAWYSFWYLNAIIAFNHMYTFKYVIKEEVIKEDIDLIVRYSFICFIPFLILIVDPKPKTIFYKLNQILLYYKIIT